MEDDAILIKIHFFLLVFMGLLLCSCHNGGVYTYVIEAINDDLILEYPNPEPVHVVSSGFIVKDREHLEQISTSSLNLHNISITIENLGEGVIEDPYLFGSDGYDFRDLSSLTNKIVDGVVEPFEKFMRVHEWFTYHYDKYGNRDRVGYGFDDYRGNPLRTINQYGGSLCGEAVQTACGLLYYVPPMGSMFGRKIQMDGHQTGEVWFDSSWHSFDISPEIRWVYFDEDNKTILPRWTDLRDDGGSLINRITPMTGWSIWSMVEKAVCKPFEVIDTVGVQWDFRYDLKPREKITMIFDMKGRTDLKSADFSRHRSYLEDGKNDFRNPCDYASAFFTYQPDFTTRLHKSFFIKQQNIKWTSRGLEPIRDDKPSSIVLPIKYTWNIVGATIDATFLKGGKIYFGVADQIGDVSFSDGIQWHELSPNQVFEDGLVTIEGRMAYWVKFEFEGAGSGLQEAIVNTEVQYSKYVMPGLKHGTNSIRFTAAEMNNSSAKVTYVYDDEAKYDFYEPATTDYGRHIYYRVGGNHIKHWTKALFYRNIKEKPEGSIPIKVEIYQVSGEKAGERVRLLKDETMRFGTYWWYWDGTDDKGNKCPKGMYSYKVTGEVGEGKYHENDQFGERLYLFDHIWPLPNEQQIESSRDN